MCTVTLFSQDNSYILTSNRDVAPDRATHELIHTSINGQRVVYPKDPMAGGTWIAIGEAGRMVCLLNGAFIKHTNTPPYRKSRGLVVLDSFEWETFSAFAKSYDFNGIEPFTLIGLDPNHGHFEFRWNRQMRFLRKLSSAPRIWSSATLYDRQVSAKRKAWFDGFLSENKQPSPVQIQDFHLYGGEKDLENGFVMNRQNIVCTTSITQVVYQQDMSKVYHRDLIHEQSATLHLDQAT